MAWTRGAWSGFMVLFVVPLALAQAPWPNSAWPQTAAEESGGLRTSTAAEVFSFVQALERPDAKARFQREVIGQSWLGRDLVVYRQLGAVDSEKLRVLIVGTIHGGEVEGKEAILELMRELAQGQHSEWSTAIDLAFMPLFNIDGNEAIDAAERVNQNGPEHGVGARENAQGLDLNRDFVKAETPEVRALLRHLERFDPHVVMDLHATNGSALGTQLTYAPSLAVNQHPALADFSHDQFLPEIQALMRSLHGYETFDYGNFEGPERSDGRRVYRTFGHEPRYFTNAIGLRNRIAVLSEAYAYLPYPERIAVTKAFCVAVVDVAARRKDEIRALTALADAEFAGTAPRSLGYASDFAPPTLGEVFAGEITLRERPGLGQQRVQTGKGEKIPAAIQVRFATGQSDLLPVAYAILQPKAEVLRVLQDQGLQVTRLLHETTLPAMAFTVSGKSRNRRPFQGRRLVRIQGEFAEQPVTLAPGTLIVSLQQPKARLAAQVLDPRSEDSLFTWGFFDEELQEGQAAPVFRLQALPTATEPLPAAPIETPPLFDWLSPEAAAPAGAISVSLILVHAGTPTKTTRFESEVEWVGRALAVQSAPSPKTVPLEAAEPWLRGLAAGLASSGGAAPTIILERKGEVTASEVLHFCRAARMAGFRVMQRGATDAR